MDNKEMKKKFKDYKKVINNLNPEKNELDMILLSFIGNLCQFTQNVKREASEHPNSLSELDIFIYALQQVYDASVASYKKTLENENT